MSLVLYGVPFSQPVRAVMWLLFLKKAPFEMVLINPGSKGETGSRNPAFLAKNPSGTIPCMEETETGFTLGEAHAIMTYLARTRGWTDVSRKTSKLGRPSMPIYITITETSARRQSDL